MRIRQDLLVWGFAWGVILAVAALCIVIMICAGCGSLPELPPIGDVPLPPVVVDEPDIEPPVIVEPLPEPPVVTGDYPWQGQPVELKRNFGTAQQPVYTFKEVAKLVRFEWKDNLWRFEMDPRKPWSDGQGSIGWVAGEITFITHRNGAWQQWWGDYFKSDNLTRQWSEFTTHLGGDFPTVGEDVWVCIADSNRARGERKRTSWIKLGWPQR